MRGGLDRAAGPVGRRRSGVSEAVAYTRELTRLLLEVIDELPPTFRDVVRLRDVEDRPPVRRRPDPVLPALAGGEFRSSRIHIDYPYSYRESERSGGYPLYLRLQRERRARRVLPTDRARRPPVAQPLARPAPGGQRLAAREERVICQLGYQVLCTARVGFRLRF